MVALLDGTGCEHATCVPPRRIAGRAGYWLWLLVALVVVAVAHRRLGPSSSATTSTVERALSSSAVQVRCWSPPTTTSLPPVSSTDISRPSARWSVQVCLPVRGYAAGWAGNRLVERMMFGRGQRWPILVALVGLVVPEPCLIWLEAADHRVPGDHHVRAGVLRR